MRNKVAKHLRKQARANTVGKSKRATRKEHRRLKSQYKKNKGQL